MAKISDSAALKWTSLRLWKHQAQSIRLILEYLKGSADRSALIRMPTGTGKTGVMAVLGQLAPIDKSILIVAPWAQLTEQLEKQIRTKFWATMEWPRDSDSSGCAFHASNR